MGVSKPAEMFLFEKSSERTGGHIAKAVIHERIKNTLHMGKQELHPPEELKKDPVAMKEFLRVAKLYSGTTFASEADEQVLARYAKTHSEYLRLLQEQENILKLRGTTLKNTKEEKALCDIYGKEAGNLFKKIEYILSVAGHLQIDNAINKKRDELLHMEDRLFLNPLSRIKHVFKQNPNKINEETLEKKGFENI